MKKQRVFYLFAAAAVIGMSSCSELMNSKSEISEVRVPGIQVVDAKGNAVSTVSGNYGEYFVKVTSDGTWSLSTSSDFVNMANVKGEGDAMIPFSVNNNWVDERVFTIDARMSDFATRAGSDVSTEVTQTPSYDFSDVVKRISSNLGTGYTLIPRADGNISMSTGLQLFNISVLDELTKTTKYNLFKDDSYEFLTQYILSSTSNEALHKGVSVGVAGSLEVGGLSGNGNVSVGVGKDSTTNNMHAVMRMLRTTFSRELDYASAIALDGEHDILTPGFRMVRNNFIKAIEPLVGDEVTAITKADSAQADLYCSQFCSSYGTTFISKALIGCSFDYYISVAKSALTDSVTVGVVLKAMYADIVKSDTTKTDSKKEETEADKKTEGTTKADADAKTDETGKDKDDTSKNDSIKVNGDIDVTYRDILNNAKNQTTAQIMIYGGNTNSVDILATGGSLEMKQLTEWRGSVTPDNAVMTDVVAVPVSALFADKPKIQAYLFDFIMRHSTSDIKISK